MTPYKAFETQIQKKKVTAYRVSKDTGIPASTFTDWKNGRSKPKIEKLQILSKYFNVPIDYFIH